MILEIQKKLKKYSILTFLLSSFVVSAQAQDLETYKAKYSNGKLKETGKQVPRSFGNPNGGDKFGEWKYYYESGKLKEVSNYDNDDRDGSFINYYENGNVKSQGSYMKDKKNGSWKFYHENGKLEKKGSFKDGYKTGTWEGYYDNGNLKFTCFLKIYNSSTSNGKVVYMEGTFKGYYDNGQLSTQSFSRRTQNNYDIYLRDASNVLSGVFYCYQGQVKDYYKNGKLKFKGSFYDNFGTGVWKYYDNKGTLTDTAFADGASVYKHIYPKNEYGYIQHDAVNLKNAERHIQSGVSLNDPFSYYWLARFYFEGINRDSNEKLGYKYLRRSFNLGSNWAAFHLGEKKEAISQLDSAIYYFKKSVVDGANNSESYLKLFQIYWLKFEAEPLKMHAINAKNYLIEWQKLNPKDTSLNQKLLKLNNFLSE